MASYTKIADGKYRLFVSSGRGADGKRLRYTRTVTAASDSHAEKLLKEFVKEVTRDSLPLPSGMTFRQLWELYLRDHVSIACAPKTMQWYEQLGKRILPAFGYMRVVAIKETHISNFYALLRDPNRGIEYEYTDPSGTRHKKILKGGLSGSFIRHYTRALTAVFNFGMAYKLIKSNPVEYVEAPRATTPGPNTFEDTDMPALIAALSCEPIKWQAAVMLALTCGLRREEVAGIKWSDIDFAKGLLRIRRAIQYIPGQPLLIGDTKTEASKRLINLPALAVALLVQWQEKQKSLLKKRITQFTELKVIDRALLKEIEPLTARLNNFGDEFVWNQPDGLPMCPDSITTYWRRFVAKSGLPHVTFHGLKHSSATLAIDSGHNVKAVSKRLGHSRVDMTLNTYAEGLQSADKKIAQTWDEMLGTNTNWHANGTKSPASTNSEK